MMRAFVGLPVPLTWAASLLRAQARLSGGRKVEGDDLHLTLAFLDDQPTDRLEALHKRLEARALPQARLRPVAYGVLGSKTPRAVVLDVAPEPGLVALRDDVRRAAQTAGITLPRDRFRPHVTLVRYGATAPADGMRLPGVMARLGVPEMPEETATGACLWSSTLTPQGPLYETLAQYPMRAA